jgi:hypothetical protein
MTMIVTEAPLPEPWGKLSAAVLDAIGHHRPGERLPRVSPGDADPYGEDLQLALYACYELHYRGFEGADPGWEWDARLLELRGVMEDVFEAALRTDVAGGSAPRISMPSWTRCSPSGTRRAGSPPISSATAAWSSCGSTAPSTSSRRRTRRPG